LSKNTTIIILIEFENKKESQERLDKMKLLIKVVGLNPTLDITFRKVCRLFEMISLLNCAW